MTRRVFVKCDVTAVAAASTMATEPWQHHTAGHRQFSLRIKYVNMVTEFRQL